jgi:hypothetical protein
MKRLILLLFLLVVVNARGAAPEGTSRPEPPRDVLRAALDFFDGSRITGVLVGTSITFQASYAKTVLPFKLVQQIQIGPDHQTGFVVMTNGDKLTGALSVGSVELLTPAGSLAIATTNIHNLKVYRNEPQRGQPWTNSVGMEFLPIESTNVLFSKWETRVEDFDAFAHATGYTTARDMFSLTPQGWKRGNATWKEPGFPQTQKHPVCGVTWEDAKAFCKWLTEKEQREGRLQENQEYRLPTDVEWSIAVGLGPEPGSTPRERDAKTPNVYPWGKDWIPPKGAGNYCGEESFRVEEPPGWEVIGGYDDGYARTSPVGSFKANRFGLFDMGGNLWEWCEEYDDPGRPQSAHTKRGASWYDNGSNRLLSSSRSPANLSRDDMTGFRCVLVFPSP